jgi:ComF family protein
VLTAYLRSIGRGFSTLVFPEACLVCAAPGSELCNICKHRFIPKPKFLSGEKFSIYSSLPYDEVSKKVILLSKEQGLVAAHRILARAVSSAISAFRLKGPASIILIPTQSKSLRRRGFNHLEEIGKLILQNGFINQEIEFINALEFTRRISDQTKLTESQRTSNLRGAFRVKKVRISNPIIVMDDVITTGSTLREAVRALQERNLTVVGAATACASQRRLAVG